MSIVRGRARTRLATLLIAFVIGALGGVAPAHARASARAMPLPAAGWGCGWTGCSYYLDRPTTQRWADFVDRWDKTSDAPAAFAGAFCTRLPNLALVAVCATAVTTGAAYFFDHLAQADAIGGCLQFQIFDLHDPGGVRIAAYDDDGRFCAGTRT